MLSGFPASVGTDPDAQIRVYLLSVDGLATEAIGRAARLFISGKVKGQNKDFAPSCASFAEECRNQQLAIEAERRPRIEPPPPRDEGPRVSPEKVRLLARHLQGDRTATAELKRLFPANEIIAMADTPVQQE